METRRFPRVAVHLKLSVTLDEKAEQSIALNSGKYFEATGTDISEGGLGLVVKKYYLPKGTKIELIIDGSPLELKKEMKLSAEVKYCRNYEAYKYKCGVKFTEISEEYIVAIRKFIAKYNNRQKTLS